MRIHNPPMTFVDAEAAERWLKCVENNSDPYGNAVVRYASEWATRMEIALHEQNVDSADEAALDAWLAANAQLISHAADTEGITGFMYGAAVNILAHAWIHGERLRRWHNKDTQVGTEGDKANETGGVLNPAVLAINTGD